MADTDSDSELSVLSSSLFTSLDVLFSNRSSNSSFTISPATQGQLSRPNLVAVPSLPPNNRPRALEHIETLLESIIDDLTNDEILKIPLRTTRSRLRNREVEGQVPVRFPGATAPGRRFGTLPHALQAHDAEHPPPTQKPYFAFSRFLARLCFLEMSSQRGSTMI